MRRLCGSAGMRRTPVRRGAPLRRAAGAVPVEVRRVLAVRSGGVCEIGLVSVCLGQARDVHHRVRRGAGGRHGAARAASDRLSNLLHVCRSCHEWVHANPAVSRGAGWLLGLGFGVPGLAVVSYRGVWRRLGDEGGVHVADGAVA